MAQRNYQKIMKSLDFEFPGLDYMPRSPITYHKLDKVDIHIARKKQALLQRLPKFDRKVLRDHQFSDVGLHLDKRFMAALAAGGYPSVAKEIKMLIEEEQSLMGDSGDCERKESFLQDKVLLGELLKGLITCAEVERSDSVSEKVRIRKMVGENMITLADFWLARKMFTKCFDYIEFIDEESDRMRVELWCLISYICIYFEDSQEIGFDLPTNCLTLAQKISQDMPWKMKKSVMNVLIPKAINVYGLKNDWIKIKADWINMNQLVTTLLHVLSVKKSRYWQDELSTLKDLQQHRWACDNIEDCLTSALAYADEVRQTPAFIATTLRRGLFYEDIADMENAAEDFNALHTLCKSFDDKETLAIAFNRLGHHKIRSKNVAEGLENFVQELNLAKDNDFDELTADAMHEVGTVLLEEAHTWEADECFSQAHALFRETKVHDTPNDLDEISWAMLGVSRGHHLWSRYTGLIRTQDKTSLKSVHEWRCARKHLPPVQVPERVSTPHRRSEFDKQYLKRRSDDTRRLFEFHSENHSLQSGCFQALRHENVFSYINASNKPRDYPNFLTSERVSWEEDDDDGEDNITAKRTAQALQRANSMGNSLMNLDQTRSTPTFLTSQLSMDKVAQSTLKSHSWSPLQERNKTVEKLESFLDNAQKKVTTSDKGLTSEEEDVSEDSEVKNLRKSSGITEIFHVDEHVD